LRVTIDARMILHTGIGRYIKNLITALVALEERGESGGGAEGGDSYAALLTEKGEVAGGLYNSEKLTLYRPRRRIPVYSFKEQWLLPFAMARTGPDLVHFPNFNLPVLTRRPFVVTIHDLKYFLDPTSCPGPAAHRFARLLFRTAAKRARKVLTVSDFTKGEIVERLGVDPARVVVTYNGVERAFRPVTDPPRFWRLRERYGIAGPFILYVGNHHPRKNLARLLEAYSGMRHRKEVQLVLTGRLDPRSAELYRKADSPKLSGRALFIDEVPEADLPAMYSMATALVFPSLYEGFGLPPLEAMSCGTPVIASAAASIPEVAGEAALFFDPERTEEIRAAMEKIVEDSELREELRTRGFYRAGIFNWEETARRTLKVYREVLAGESGHSA